MSTRITENVSAIVDEGVGIVQPRLKLMPPKDMSPFQENVKALAVYLRDARTSLGLSLKDVADIARKKNTPVSSQNIQQYETGDTPNPSLFVLVCIANGLSKPVREVISVALGEPIEETPAFKKSEFGSLYESHKHLPSTEQRFQKRVLQMLERENNRILKQLEESDDPLLEK